MKYRLRSSLVILSAALLLAGLKAYASNPTVSINWIKLYHGFDALAEADGNETALFSDSNVLRFFGNSRRLEVNGILVWLNAPLTQSWGRWRLDKADLDKTVLPLLKPSEILAIASQPVIVLDAGHGGKDRGMTDPWQGREEKAFTLLLAEEARALLEARSFEVRLTRSGDEWVELSDRCRRAAEFGASLFVSIHLNGAANPDASGVETHILPLRGYSITAEQVSEASANAQPCAGNEHDEANLLLGFMIQSKLVEGCGAVDRGVRRSRFYVLRNAPCPAALVECGFMSNKEEWDRLLNADYRRKIAEAIADGIASYIEKTRKTRR